jgi:hypothetical protein
MPVRINGPPKPRHKSPSTLRLQRQIASQRRSKRWRAELERQWFWLTIEQQRAARGERLLAELADAVAKSLSSESLCLTVAKVCVPEFVSTRFR